MAIQSHIWQPEIIAENVPEDAFFRDYTGFYEWVNGKVIKMSPITRGHNQLTRYLAQMLEIYFKYRPIGDFETAPYTMHLPGISNREPDIQIVLGENRQQMTATRMNGAADICIEITSPGTVVTDRGAKFAEYASGGVREYWLIDRVHSETYFYRLNDNGQYKMQSVPKTIYTTPLLPDLQIDTGVFWQETLPDSEAVTATVKALLNV